MAGGSDAGVVACWHAVAHGRMGVWPCSFARGALDAIMNASIQGTLHKDARHTCTW